MKKFGILFIAFILIVFPLQLVEAAYPASYSSTVNVTNTTGGDGLITLQFFDSAGTLVKKIENLTIAPYETKYFTSFAGLTTNFDGGMVISSNVSLASLSMIKGKNSDDSAKNYASYIGASAGSLDVYLPLLMKDNFGYNTYFYVQNTSANPVDVDIVYSDGRINNSIRGLPASASVKIDNRSESHSALSFSARLSATGSIAVAVVEYSSGQQGDQLFSYSGFPNGSSNPIFPMINENNSGYWTSANIQNIGTLATTVTLTYYPTEAGQTCTEKQTIPAGAKRDFATYAFAWDPSMYSFSVSTNCSRYEKFIGTAVVTSNSTNQPLVGIVNQINNKNDPNKGAALMSLNQSSGSDTVVFPYVQQWVGSQQWWTSWNIINVSGSTISSDDIVCTVKGSGKTVTFRNPSSLANGKGWLKQFYQSYTSLPNGFVGGAVCKTTSGKAIVGSSNILAANAGIAVDSLAVYEGINP